MTAKPQCPDTAQLQALLDGTLSEEDQSNLADHLTGCDTCRQRFDEMSERLDVLGRAIELIRSECGGG